MRQHRLLPALLVAVSFSTSLLSSAIASHDGLHIFYSGNTNGNLKACG